MLEAGGLEIVTDRHRVPDESNPRGYFELERVKSLEGGDVSWVTDARGKVVKVIAYLLEHLPSTLNYRVIFIIRNLDEVLGSQAKMLALRGESDGADNESMREIFYGHMAGARRLLTRESCFDVLYLRHEEVLRDPGNASEQIAGFIQSGLDIPAMAAVVDPALHRTRVEE